MKESVKKIVCLLLICLLVISSCPISISAAENAETTAGVYLRSGPGTNYSQLDLVYEGTRIEVLDTSNSQWYKVKANGKEGYITSEWIELDEGATVNTTAEKYKTTTDVNFRQGPSSFTTKIGTVPEGTIVTLISKYNSEWYKIKTPEGTEGYLCTDYLVKYEGSSQGSSSGSTSASLEKYKTTTNVNFRQGPSSFTTKIGVVAEGTVVTLISKYNSEWYKIKTPEGVEGYLCTEYLVKAEETSGSENNNTEKKYYKTTTDVNFRSGPSSQTTKIGTVTEGTVVTFIEQVSTEWFKVQTPDGTVGYLCNLYLVECEGNTESEGSGSENEGNENNGNENEGSAGELNEQYRVIATSGVNVRKGPGTSYSVITAVIKGTIVTVTAKDNSGWYAVTLSSGTKGYIKKDYLEKYEASTGGSENEGNENENPEETREQYKTTTDVNFRSGPSSYTTKIGVVPEGTIVYLVEKYNSSWYKIETPEGVIGYLCTDYLVKYTGEETEEPEEEEENSEKYKTTTDVNFRSGPSTSYTKIGTVPEGTIVTLIEKYNSSWYKIKTPEGTVGYLHTDYLVKYDGSENSSGNGGSTTNVSYMQVTASSGLWMRDNPSGNKVTLLNYGTVLILLDDSNPEWTRVKTTDDVYTGYVSSEYITEYTPSSVGNVGISSNGATIPQYSTFYVKADSSSSSLIWSTDDASIATVNSGFIYGAGIGTTNIYLKDLAGNVKATFKITVTIPEAARFAYAAPVEGAEDGTYQFVAVTDNSKSSLRFVTDSGETFTATSYTGESYENNSVRVFKTTGKLSEGEHKIKVYADNTNNYKEFTVLVSGSNDPFVSSTEERMASVKIVETIASFEGYVPSVTPDTLAYNVPTLGYGYVVYKNTIFYNHLTKSEALAMLYQTINEGVFTTSINSLIDKYDIEMNQNQFDSLISFAYNVGTAWTSSSYIRTMLLNCADYTQISFPADASVLFGTGIYTSYDGGSYVATLTAGTDITVLEMYVDGYQKLWYKVSTGSEEGWLRGGNITFDGGFTRDLNYMDAQMFAYRLLEWHVAGGKCWPGLLYRRLAEAKIFLYGNYAEASASASNYKYNTYKFQYPSCMSSYQ